MKAKVKKRVSVLHDPNKSLLEKAVALRERKASGKALSESESYFVRVTQGVIEKSGLGELHLHVREGAPQAAGATPAAPAASSKPGALQRLLNSAGVHLETNGPARSAEDTDEKSEAGIFARFDAMPSDTFQQKEAKLLFYAEHEDVLSQARPPGAAPTITLATPTAALKFAAEDEAKLTPAMAKRAGEKEALFVEFEQLSGAERSNFYEKHEAVLSRPRNPRRK